MVEGFGGLKWWRDLVEVFVGGGIWWRDFVEPNGGDVG